MLGPEVQEIIEVEIKIRVDRGLRDSIPDAVLSIGGTPHSVQRHVDRYYQHPCRNFSRTDEALRLREVSFLDSAGRSIVEITYKGPKIDPLSKTRTELTTGVEDAKATDTLFHALGFAPVREVRKTRTTYRVGDVLICVDDVDELGVYVELECSVESPELVPAARNELLALARRLGLDPDLATRESYLSLLLARDSDTGS